MDIEPQRFLTYLITALITLSLVQGVRPDFRVGESVTIRETKPREWFHKGNITKVSEKSVWVRFKDAPPGTKDARRAKSSVYERLDDGVDGDN